ncbi:MAG: c-type cytochrome [Proteobacteria bacterium]|nr:c-type cytochrome [Pseudomonadota bacterium]
MNKPFLYRLTLSSIILTGIFLSACTGEEKASSESGEELIISATNPLNGRAGAIEEGLKLFAIKCSQCHGPAGAGGPEAPDLTDGETNYGDADDDLFRIIWYGTPNGMPTWEKNLGKENIWKIVAYLKNIKKKP